MNNPIPRYIPHSSLFVTPKDLTELDVMIRQLPATEHATVYQYVMFAFNLAYKLIEESK